MLFNRKQTTLILMPFAAIILSIIAFSNFKFKPVLSSTERDISRFSYKKIEVFQKQPITVTDLKSPIDISAAAPKDFPKIPLSEIFPREIKKEKKVVLIFMTENRKMAIINDIVVKEGDIIDHGRVKKIERNRVLIKDKEGEEWLKIE